MNSLIPNAGLGERQKGEFGTGRRAGERVESEKVRWGGEEMRRWGMTFDDLIDLIDLMT